MKDDAIMIQAERQVQIETYEVEDAEWAGDEIDKEAYVALAEKIGAKKQVELVETEGAIPFQRMSDAVKNTWIAFCPSRHGIDAYAEAMIPMRVMKLAEHCIDKGYFEKIEIWAESETNPDPVMVGIAEGLSRGYYLIARWGESLMSWPEIVKEAREKWMKTRTNDLNATITDAQGKLGRIDADADKYFNGGWVF